MTTKQIVILVFCLFLGASLAHAEWLLNGKPAMDSPYAKTKGDFGAQIIFTDKPEKLFEEWDKDQEAVKGSFVDEIQRNNSASAFILFSNCAPDPKGMCNVSVKFTAYDPTGKIIMKTKEQEVWINKPVGAYRMLELSVDYLILSVKKKSPTGLYMVKALVHDKNSDIKLDLARELKIFD